MRLLPLTTATGANDATKQVSTDVWNAGHEAIGCADRTALAALPTETGKLAYLAEAGREGLFKWDASDLSAWVTRDPEQGIYIAPSSDTDGSSGAWVRQFDGPYNVKWWGAKGDGTYTGLSGTDDTAAIQAALDFLDNRQAGQTRGGTLFFPAGQYICASSLDLNRMVFIEFRGQHGIGGHYTAPGLSQLVFTGTGTRFIEATSTSNTTFRDIGIRYTDSDFDGDLIDLSKEDAFGDTAYALIERCVIGGQGITSARRLINLNGAILCSVVDCHIGWGQVGIGGRHMTEGPGYSNAHYFARITFDNLTTTAALNAVEGWTFDTCWFEGTNGGSGGMPRAYWDDMDAGSITSGLSFHGCWFGDAVNVTDCWIGNNNTAIWGLDIAGGIIATWDAEACPVIKLTAACRGVSIHGCSINNSIDLDDQLHRGVHIVGNFIWNEVANVSASANNVFIACNQNASGTTPTIIRHSSTDGGEFTVGTFGAANSGDADFFGIVRTDGMNLFSGGVYKVNDTQVVGAQGAAVADATDAASVITQLNALLARCRAHGLIAT